MWPILLGNVIASKFVETPPRSATMGLFTGKSYPTAQLQLLYPITTSLSQWLSPSGMSGKSIDDLLSLLDMDIREEHYLYITMVLLRRFRHSPDAKDSLVNTLLSLYERTPLYRADQASTISQYMLAIVTLCLSPHPSVESVLQPLNLPSATHLIDYDLGHHTCHLQDILQRSLVAIHESTTYADALRLSLYLSRSTALTTTVTSVIATAIYGREYQFENAILQGVSPDDQHKLLRLSTLTGSDDAPLLDEERESLSYKKKSKLTLLPKRFERRSIHELCQIPQQICRFRGPFHFLSNMFPSPLSYEGITYSALECAYHGAKYMDQEKKEKFGRIQLPYKARSMSRSAKGMRPDWDMVKVDIMRELLRIIFSHPELQQALLATGDAHLEEGNTWGDRFWGTVNGDGDNVLGQLLMETRDYYRTHS